MRDDHLMLVTLVAGMLLTPFYFAWLALCAAWRWLRRQPPNHQSQVIAAGAIALLATIRLSRRAH